MSPQPALFAILDEIIANLRATSGYGAPMSGAPVPVYDGAELATSDDNPSQYICVGWTPNGDETGSLQTSGGTFGARADNQEDGTLYVTCVAASGDTDASVTRALLKPMVATVLTAAYGLTDPSYTAYWETAQVELRQDQTAAGFTSYAVVQLSYSAHLGA